MDRKLNCHRFVMCKKPLDCVAMYSYLGLFLLCMSILGFISLLRAYSMCGCVVGCLGLCGAMYGC